MDSLTRIFGPYDGQLDNSGDAVELVRPDVPQPPSAPDAGAVYYILADKVNYSDLAPWPELADGTGDSIQRVVGELKLGSDWRLSEGDAVDKLERMIEVTREPGTEIITIHANSNNEAEARKIEKAPDRRLH